MATATAQATTTTPTTLQGHDHKFQYLPDDQRSQFTNTTNEVSPSDILAQLNAAEEVARNASNATPVHSHQTTPSMVTPPRERSHATPLVANTSYQAPSIPPAPMKPKKDDDEFPYYNESENAIGENESVEISHLIAQQEQAPPSPIPYIPEHNDYIHMEEGPIEEPFDCVPVDDSAEGIMKQLEQVVHKSDRVLHPDHYDPKGKKLLSETEMAMMTPKRSGDPMKSPANSDCGSSTITGLTLGSRASVSIKGINKKPTQPIMKLRVNDSQFEPLTSVINEQEEMPFDETTSHNFKTALRNILTVTKAAVLTSPNATPDTTMMEDSETDDDTTTHYGDEDDEWTADDTSKYTDGSTTAYTDDDTATSGYTMDTPMDEQPTTTSKKSRKAQRRKQLLARARAVDQKTKEQAGWDELLLDAVFSPDVTETALEVADYLQSGAEVTISMTKGMLQDAVTQLEKEEKELNGDGIPEGEELEQEEDMTNAGEAAHRNIAAAATGSNLNDSEVEQVAEQQEQAAKEDTNTTSDSTPQVKDPWDQPQEAFGKEQSSFADLMQKGLPLMNRKLARVVQEWTNQNNNNQTNPEQQEQEQVEDRASTTKEEEEEENVVEPGVAAAETEPIEAETNTEEAEEEKKESEEDDNDKKPDDANVEQEESPEEDLIMAKLELEDAQDAAAAEEEASTMSLEKPTKRLSV